MTDSVAAPPDSIIEIRGVTRRFGALTAVDHIDLSIPRGEIFGLVGPDGAGKTTTLRMLCGLMDPTEGQVIVAGQDVAKNVEAVRDRIGYMAQQFGLYTDLSVDENMIFYGDLFGVVGAERDKLMTQLLRMTRMEPFRSRPAGWWWARTLRLAARAPATWPACVNWGPCSVSRSTRFPCTWPRARR